MTNYVSFNYFLIKRGGAVYKTKNLIFSKKAFSSVAGVRFDLADTLVPLVSQEVWGAGVTYYRSRDARMAESEEAGGGSFYDRVYTAQRPELFFKGNSRTTVGHGDCIGIRTDARWSVPEPELVLLSNANGELIGCTMRRFMID